MKIGITLDMSAAFWVNGMQQNIVFLHSLLKSIGHDCMYITYKKPMFALKMDHKGIMLNDLLQDRNEKLDILIVAGFDLLPEMYNELMSRNKDLKVVLIHFGNKLMDDIHYGICNTSTQKMPLKTPYYLSQIWTSPQHEFSKEYIKTYYNFDNVITTPFIWDPFFVQEKISELKKKGLSPFYSEGKKGKVCIFEPNISHVKNCIIPLSICERFNQKFPNKLNTVSCFSSEKVRETSYFLRLMNRSSIVQNINCHFNNRWSSLDALSKFGSTVISHQYDNNLNYAYFEALYLGLPLIHNSEAMQEVGYFYPKFDVKMGANQLYSSFINHDKVEKEYMQQSREFLNKFNIHNQSNKNLYNKIINEIK